MGYRDDLDDFTVANTPPLIRRPHVTISFDFTLFGEDRDEAYAQAMADGLFEHLASAEINDAEGNEWDYSIDGVTIDYSPARSDSDE